MRKITINQRMEVDYWKKQSDFQIKDGIVELALGIPNELDNIFFKTLENIIIARKERISENLQETV